MREIILYFINFTWRYNMKYAIILIDGMADEKIEKLNYKTPFEVAKTPNIDKLAKEATFGTFLTLPDEFPTSSDVANMSVLGWDLKRSYTGRGAVESYGAGILMTPDMVAFRMNLITVKDGLIEDYSAGHISEEEARVLIDYLKENLDTEEMFMGQGVSYRHLLYFKGEKYSPNIAYEKPDSSHGIEWETILPKALDEKAKLTEEKLIKLVYKSKELLENHPINIKRVKEGKNPANIVWPWSGGGKPDMQTFYEMYNKKGAIVSAVDVILGLGRLGEMDIDKPEGATGFIDTNYENKAIAAVELLKKNDFVYLHVEAVDECGHMGDLEKKIDAIESVDKRLVGKFLEVYYKEIGEEIRIMILPDHPVPIRLRQHTRDKVPFMVWGKNVKVDENIKEYNEETCKNGKYTNLKGRELMDLLFANEEI